MKNERILSYNLARELSKDEINTVSGANLNVSVITTQQWTGGQGVGDMVPDTRLDN